MHACIGMCWKLSESACCSLISEPENLWERSDSTLPLRVSLCGWGLGKKQGLRSLGPSLAMNAFQPLSPCCAPCGPADVPALILPRQVVSLALWWRNLVKIAAAHAGHWDAGRKALESWPPRAARYFGPQGSAGFILGQHLWLAQSRDSMQKWLLGHWRVQKYRRVWAGWGSVSREPQPKEAPPEPPEGLRAGTCVCTQLN